MNEKLKEFFDSRIADCAARRDALISEQRFDEADMEKIRGNVYDIFRTVLGAAERACGDEAGAREFFRLRSEQIPTAWHDSLAKASAHGDDVKAAIERVKIEAIEDIKAKAAELWEVEA